ncbi:hypothetical protein NM688_g8942 [Phlebia brevispora]|uniref:Uncharacterized protein n=1 Tax=Phlebia brevispora TaxID=194682 RepID=A0ACC1RLW9_9APHY|nr:hypothetical protein NM688_g8942 [Phlebia brevispora]
MSLSHIAHTAPDCAARVERRGRRELPANARVDVPDISNGSIPSSPASSNGQIRGVAGSSIPGTPGLGGDDGMDISPQDADLFGAFSSITLHYDGES